MESSAIKEMEIVIRLIERKVKGMNQDNLMVNATVPEDDRKTSNITKTNKTIEDTFTETILDEQLILLQGETMFEFAPIQSESKVLYIEVNK